MAVKLSNLDFQMGKVNPSGILPIAFCIPKRSIISWPTIVDDSSMADATLDKMVNYEGDFVLAAGANFISIYTTQGKGKVTSESQGELDGKSYINKATLSFPVIDDQARGYAKLVVNDDFIYIIPAPGKKYHVIGHPDYRTSSTPAFDSGDAATSAHGMTINIECTDTTPLPCYKGDIVLEASTLDCATGIETPKTADGGA